MGVVASWYAGAGHHGICGQDESEPMTVRQANEIRETGLPVYCSGCMNQQPELRHVDFDAACDRGYGPDHDTKIAMDDLVLCENCVREGAAVLGIEDSVKVEAERDDYARKYDAERLARQKAERYADTLEDAIGNRPAPISIDHRRKPRQPRKDYEKDLVA